MMRIRSLITIDTIPGHRKNTEQGIALLMVLWILMILMVIVFSFSYMARTEIYATMSFKGGIEKKFLAEAGLERGIMELFYRQFYRSQTIDIEGREIWKTDDTPYQGQVGDGLYTVRITDETAKVDINTVSEVVLKNLFLNLGVQAEEVDTIVDSIMDWKDPDDLHRLHGAESDYYMSLPNPYKAKDANFETLEELLLVKGMTPEILYGTNEKKGAIDFLTLHSRREDNQHQFGAERGTYVNPRHYSRTRRCDYRKAKGCGDQKHGRDRTAPGSPELFIRRGKFKRFYHK